MTTAHRSSSAARKTAISVPPALLRAVDAAARSRGESRSRFIQEVLAAAVGARRDAEIRKRIDALFSGATPQRKQRSEAGQLEKVHGWSREKW